MAKGQITLIDVTDSCSLALETPDGTTFKGNFGNPLTLNIRLRQAGTDVTSSADISWYFNGTLNGAMHNATTMEVYPSDVPGSLVIKIVAVYSGKTYENSVSFYDLDDVYQVTIIGEDKIKNSSESVTLKAKVFRGTSEITLGFRCRWTNIRVEPAVVLYEGINTTGSLIERGVEFTLNPEDIDGIISLLCEISVDTVEQSNEWTEQTLVPSYDSRAYAAAMSVALS